MISAGSVSSARKASARAQDRSVDMTAPAGSGQQRVVGSRRYEQQGTQWKDLGQQSQRVVNVEAYSAAYFALLTALPELRDAAALGDDVLIAGRKVSIRIQRVGQATMASSEVSQVAKDFRGA